MENIPPKISVIGEALIEMVHLQKEGPNWNGTASAHDCIHTIGGSAAVSALAIAEIGAIPQLISRSATDAVGHLFRELLEESGVSASYLDLSGTKAPCRLVRVESCGARTVSQFDGAGLTSDPSWIALPSDADVVLVDGHCTASAIALLDQANLRDIPSLVYVTQDIDPVVMHVASHVVFTCFAAHQAFPMLSPSEAAMRAQAEYGGWFGVRDSAGSIAFCGPDGWGEYEDYQEPNDTLGYSHDIWRAGFAVGLTCKGRADLAVKFANTTVELSSQQHSGQFSVPSAGEIKRYVGYPDVFTPELAVLPA